VTPSYAPAFLSANAAEAPVSIDRNSLTHKKVRAQLQPKRKTEKAASVALNKQEVTVNNTFVCFTLVAVGGMG